MTHDMDLVRAILLRTEQLSDDEAEYGLMSLEGYEALTFTRHVELMAEAGLVKALWRYKDARTRDVTEPGVQRLTWQGHDLLDAIRNEQVWAKTKTTVIGTVGSVAVDVLKTIAGQIALNMVGFRA